LNLAIQFLEQKKHIAFFSYEMSSKDLLTRIISIKTGLSMREIQQGNLIEPDKQIFLSVQSWINERLQYFHCFDCAGLSVEGLRAKALSIHYQTGVEAIFIDYVQLIAAPAGMYDANQKQEYNVIKLQHLKKQIGCALVALSQLRKTKTTDRPTASDLKGAQVLEATATKIILLDSKHKRGQLQYEDGTPTMGKIDVYCDKNRNGCLFSVRLNYTGYCYKFADEQQAIFNENFENLGESAPF
jgi:replicative DNA helicase